MSLRIATWNLEHPVEQWAQASILDRMAAVSADLWVLTETHDDVVPRRNDDVPPRQAYHAVSSAPRRGSSPGERWVTIWSRHPILGQHETSDPERTVAVTVELCDGRHLLVYGTVLPWCGDAWGGFPSKGAVAYTNALERQASDWQRLQAAHPGTPLCVAGDFNQDLSRTQHYYWSKVARAALRKQLCMAGLEALTGDEADPVARASDGRKRCIDHVCVSHHLAANTRSEAWPPYVNGREVSDHYGIVVTLAEPAC